MQFTFQAKNEINRSYSFLKLMPFEMSILMFNNLLHDTGLKIT